MTKEEIKTLGTLSRIALSEVEIETFKQDIESIITYVSAVKNIAAIDQVTPAVGVTHNVFREDVVTNTPGHFTAAMLTAMPKTQGQYLSVKKILKQTT